jgi:hypothetical protein
MTPSTKRMPARRIAARCSAGVDQSSARKGAFPKVVSPSIAARLRTLRNAQEVIVKVTIEFPDQSAVRRGWTRTRPGCGSAARQFSRLVDVAPRLDAMTFRPLRRAYQPNGQHRLIKPTAPCGLVLRRFGTDERQSVPCCTCCWCALKVDQAHAQRGPRQVRGVVGVHGTVPRHRRLIRLIVWLNSEGALETCGWTRSKCRRYVLR